VAQRGVHVAPGAHALGVGGMLGQVALHLGHACLVEQAVGIGVQVGVVGRGHGCAHLTAFIGRLI